MAKGRRLITAIAIISFTLVCCWLIGIWPKATTLKADETQTKLKQAMREKVEVPRLEDIKPILKKILPQASEFRRSKKEFSQECLACYLCLHAGEKVGVVSLFRLEGQWGPMVLLMGVNMNKEISRIELSYHTETPRCGSQIEKRPFLDQFTGKTIDEPLEIYQDLLEATDAVKGVDCITRATVSSTAIAKGVKKELKVIVESFIEGEEDVWR